MWQVARLVCYPEAHESQAASPKGLFLASPTDHVDNITACLPKLDSIKWILVVEKEATFNLLKEMSFHRQCLAGPGLIVTVSLNDLAH
jgi:hypothetical protein